MACSNLPTAGSSQLPGSDEPIQLIEFVKQDNAGNTTIQLKKETVATLIQKTGNRPLSIICICGPSRKGKSFMLGYMLRYLEAYEKEELDWMDWSNPTKQLQGFRFRNGDSPETQGIWVWSRPFILKDDNDKEVAVILIDTQGTYDEFTTNKDMSVIVGLSLLTSSVMIYNMFTNLQEDALTSLATYTSFGQLALDNLPDGTTPFQRLIFLIRDWNNPGEYPFGAKGGKRFLEKKLNVKSDQAPEAKELRESVKTCFKDTDCFLMPFIGNKALGANFKGSISELEKDFSKRIEEFINDLFSAETLVIKKILGNEVTAQELFSSLEYYIGIFNSNEVPSATTMWEATTDVTNTSLLQKACDKFQELIKKKRRGRYYLAVEVLEGTLTEAKKQALAQFKKARKFGTQTKIQEYEEKLETTLEEEIEKIRNENGEKRDKYLAETVAEAETAFRTLLEKTVPLLDKEEENQIVFYEDSVVDKVVQQSRDKVIAELKEKLEEENEQAIQQQIKSLDSKIDVVIASHVNKNKARRAEAEKKMVSLVEVFNEKFEKQLRSFHESNQFATDKQVEKHHKAAKESVLDCWSKESKPGSKDFQKEYDAKLEKELITISSRVENEHKLGVQKHREQIDAKLSKILEEYKESLNGKKNSVKSVDELDKINSQVGSDIWAKFDKEGNVFPRGHELHEHYNEKLKAEMKTIFDQVKRELVQTLQQIEESYRNAVHAGWKCYKTQISQILDSSDFISEEDLQTGHEKVQRKALAEYENFDKIGCPEDSGKYKQELEEKIQQHFERLKQDAVLKRELVISKSKNCVTDCEGLYNELMKKEMNEMKSESQLEELHKRAMNQAKQKFLSECPANLVSKFGPELDEIIEETYAELKDLLKLTWDQEESEVKTILADCRQYYNDEMQKHCKNTPFIRPDQLEGYHNQACKMIISKFEKTVKLSANQKSNLEQEMEALYEKYKRENDMKLNFLSDEPPAIGIDLGTTYCCVGVYYNGKVIIIPNQEQGNVETTASYVMYNSDGSTTIGNDAKKNAYSNPENTIYDAKRIIGRKFDDPMLQKDMTFWPFKVEEGQGKEKGIPKINVGGNLLFPEQISKELLSKFRQMAEKHLGLSSGAIKKAVITVPAYFNDGQRQATVDAGDLAGLKVLTILNEPTAAAIAYSLERLDNSARKVLVFDLGGGTFDVALVDVAPKSINVLGIGGDTHLGGEDFDQNMMEYCALKFKEQTGIDLMDGKNSSVRQERDDTRRRLKRLQAYCETAKRELSSGTTTTVTIDAMFDGMDLSVEVTRAKFEELNKHLFENTIQAVDKVLKDAGVSKEQIDDVVLVGGSTRIPKVQDMLSEYFKGKALNFSIDPDKAVAYGAAIKAAMMNGEQARGKLQFDKIEDVTPLPIGIEVVTKKLEVVMPKNTKIPDKRERPFTTVEDNQTIVLFKIFQGEDPIAAENELLGEFTLTEVPPNKAGVETLDVSMEMDTMGILQVEAVCRSTKGSNKIIIQQNRYRMSKEAKARLMAERKTLEDKKLGNSNSRKTSFDIDTVTLPKCIQELKTQHFSHLSIAEIIKLSTKSHDKSLTPAQNLVWKYSGSALQTGRPLDSALIVMAGASGAGKSMTINALFEDNNLCKTSTSASETSHVALIRKKLRVSAENPAIIGYLGFVDVPGTFDTNVDKEAANMARIRAFKASQIELADRKDSEWKLPGSPIRTSVYPNLVLFVVSAGDKRMDGKDSKLAKSLEAFEQTADFIDRKYNNVIVVLTHVMSLPRQKDKFIQRLGEITRLIQQQVYRILKIINVEVIPVENEPVDYCLEKGSHGFYLLPNGAPNHLNLFQAMLRHFENNKDLIGRLFTANYFSSSCPAKLDRALVTFFSRDNLTEEEIAKAANDLKNLKISGGYESDSIVPTYNFQSLGHGYCPVSEEVKMESIYETQGHSKKVKIAQSKFLVPEYVQVYSKSSSSFRKLTFLEQEEYESYMQHKYGLEVGFKLVVSASSEGRWLNSKSGLGSSSLVSLVQEMQIASLSLKSPKKQSLHPDFKKELDSLPDKYSSSTADHFQSFFSKWGSHVITEQAVGGAVQFNCTVDQASLTGQQLTEIEANVSGVYKNTFSGSAGYSFSNGMKGLKQVGVSNVHFRVDGGIPPPLVSVDTTGEELREWSKTVSQNPTELRSNIKLLPYYDFLGFGGKYTALKDATREYLNSTMVASILKNVRSNRDDIAKQAEDKVVVEPGPKCFPKGALVTTWSGEKVAIENLSRFQNGTLKTCKLNGGKLFTFPKVGKYTQTEFCTYLDRQDDCLMEYLEFEFSNGKVLTASPGHMLFEYVLQKKAVLGKQAKRFQIGDMACYMNGDTMDTPSILKISRKFLPGAYSPLTSSGTLIVDGFLVTCYAHTDSFLQAQIALQPLKLWYKMKKNNTKIEVAVSSGEKDDLVGLHPFAKWLISFRNIKKLF